VFFSIGARSHTCGVLMFGLTLAEELLFGLHTQQALVQLLVLSIGPI
jgi:hypothetical protein